MRNKVHCISYLILCSVFTVHAASTVECATYKYGDDLDVKSVVSINNNGTTDFDCGAVNEEMEYKDSNGKLHKLVYQAVSKSCQW